MSSHRHMDSQEWYHEAARYYLEGHQACAWCGGRYRVFKTERSGGPCYYCHACDFFVGQEPGTGEYYMVPGQVESESPALASLSAC